MPSLLSSFRGRTIGVIILLLKPALTAHRFCHFTTGEIPPVEPILQLGPALRESLVNRTLEIGSVCGVGVCIAVCTIHSFRTNLTWSSASEPSVENILSKPK